MLTLISLDIIDFIGFLFKDKWTKIILFGFGTKLFVQDIGLNESGSAILHCIIAFLSIWVLKFGKFTFLAN